MKKAIATLILLTMVFGLWGGLEVACASVSPVQVGQRAFDFTATLLDGSSFQLSDYLGKVVFVNVWASWCGPCVNEIPDLQKLSEAYPETLVVLGLNNQETQQTASQFVADNSLTYPQASDENGTLINSVFPTQYIPYTVVIDPNGVVTQAEAGGQSYDVFDAWYQEAAANLPETSSVAPTATAPSKPMATLKPTTTPKAPSASTLSGLTCTPVSDSLSYLLQWTDQADGLSYDVDITPSGSPRSFLTSTATEKTITVDNLLPDTEYTFTVTEPISGKTVSQTLTTGSVGKYTEFGAVPNMANFIYVKIPDLVKAENNIRKAKYSKIKTVKTDALPLSGIDAYYFMYLKWTYGKSSPDHFTNMTFFLQTPDNELYCTSVYEYFTGTPSPRYYWYWYVDVSDIISSYQADHATFQPGKYTIWIYYNALFFRKSNFTVK